MKIAIYARVSTEKQEKQETINSQLSALRDYAKEQNYLIVNEYIDEGYSGELLDRPSLDRLRDDAKKNIFEAILIHSPDRFSRKYINLGLVQEELKKHSVRLIFLNRPDSKDSPEDSLLNGVQGLIAEYEKEKIKERTRRGRTHKAKSGLLVTSQAPYGYKYILGDKRSGIVGHYELEFSEVKIVKLIFELFVDKRLSIRAIARELTSRGIKPQRGKEWRTSSLHRIIRNETYMGLAHYNKHVGCEPKKTKNNKYRRYKNTSMKLRPKDQWIPIKLPKELVIIEERVFKMAQKQLKTNSNMSPRNVKYQYLLRGLVKCGHCDSPYQGTPMHGITYYRCGNRNRTFPHPKECSGFSIKSKALEDIVWSKFTEAIRNPRLITEQVQKLKEIRKTKKVGTESDLQLLEKRLLECQIQEERLLDAYREKALSIEQLKEQMNKIRGNKERLDQEVILLKAQQENRVPKSLVDKSIQEYCRQIDRKLEALENDFEGRRYLLTLALNKVVIEGKKVRIKGIIPTYSVEQPTSTGCIDSTVAGHYGHNATFEYELVASL